MTASPSSSGQSGNVIVFILMAVVLIGVITAAIRSGGNERANIDQETLVIRAADVRQHASEFERAVAYLLQNGISESAIRFAHGDAPSDYGSISTTPEAQVFSRAGGGAAYRPPPTGIQVATAPWEFYGQTALPQAGSNRAELIAVLPGVTEAFCREINKTANPGGTSIPTDDGDCLNGGSALRFSNTVQFEDTGPNTLNGTFTTLPAAQGCVRCADTSYNFFHALMTR